jgi:hypothetical protein
MKGYIDVDIKEPMFKTDKGSFVYIYDKFIKQADREKKYLRIKVPDGVMVTTAKKWMKGANRMEKVFKIPTMPMILYGNYVQVSRAYAYEIGEDGKARLTTKNQLGEVGE